MKLCPYCGVEMTNPRRVQCGAPECQRLYNNAKQRRMNDAWRAIHGHARTQEYDPWYECKQCGAEYRSAQRPEKTSFCSIACSNKARRIRPALPPVRVRRALRQLERAAKGTKGKGVFAYGHCSHCGMEFMKFSCFDPPKYCSHVCKRRSVKRRNTERRRAANPHFDRDKNRKTRRNRLKAEQQQKENAA